MATRPRIQFLVDRPRRAQARTARAIARHVADEFECRVRYESDAPDLADWPCDLLWVSSWDSTWYRRFELAPYRIVKSVGDLRWAVPGGGALAAAELAATWLADAALVACCSERLRALLAPHREVVVTPVGFDPFVFPARIGWRGPLQFGWAGEPDDPTSGFRDVLEPAAGAAFPLRTPSVDLQLAEIGCFFRSIDVFALAAEREGAPLTLVEALASGCFPVCVDVDIVPELVVHGENGLIVERDPRAFRDAFTWCASHADEVRRAGRANAERLRHRRTWEHVAEPWRAAFRRALAQAPRPVAPVDRARVAVPTA